MNLAFKYLICTIKPLHSLLCCTLIADSRCSSLRTAKLDPTHETNSKTYAAQTWLFSSSRAWLVFALWFSSCSFSKRICVWVCFFDLSIRESSSLCLVSSFSFSIRKSFKSRPNASASFLTRRRSDSRVETVLAIPLFSADIRSFSISAFCSSSARSERARRRSSTSRRWRSSWWRRLS